MGQAILMGQRGSKIKMVSGVISLTQAQSAHDIYSVSFSGLDFTPTGFLMWFKSAESVFRGVGAIFWNTGQTGSLYPYSGYGPYSVLVYEHLNTGYSSQFTVGGATVAAAKGILTVDTSDAGYVPGGGKRAAPPILGGDGSAKVDYNYVIWGE